MASRRQLQHLRGQRRDSATIELIRSVQDPELARAFTLIMSLPRGISADELQAKGPQYVEAANLIGLRFEMLAVLVYRGAIGFHVAEDLTQGGVVAIWARLEQTAMHTRKTQSRPPAHELHRDWEPGKDLRQ